jgi:hypothetical protein
MFAGAVLFNSHADRLFSSNVPGSFNIINIILEFPVHGMIKNGKVLILKKYIASMKVIQKEHI